MNHELLRKVHLRCSEPSNEGVFLSRDEAYQCHLISAAEDPATPGNNGLFRTAFFCTNKKGEAHLLPYEAVTMGAVIRNYLEKSWADAIKSMNGEVVFDADASI